MEVSILYPVDVTVVLSGVKKLQYDIWGDTRNTASRKETSGAAGKVHISEAIYELLNDDTSTSLCTGPQFYFESHGKVEAKGKGEVELFDITGQTLKTTDQRGDIG